MGTTRNQAEAARATVPERDRDLWARVADGRDLPLLSAAVSDHGEAEGQGRSSTGSACSSRGCALANGT